ncbi:anti-sigma factor domain-containing protein [Qipengyuania sp. ASV99]|uniref:anti-sigma factor n=1 Tax=Qipengyuania sp. ASV99 TaxID=3399681 RepID=UPI003A4C63F0
MSEETGTNFPKSERDDPMIAAELALGLLEGEELLAARGKAASDNAFAARKAWWDNWFAPWTDEIAGAQPGAHVWDEIAARIAAQQVQTAAPAANVVALETRLRRWQWATGITSAAAALAIALLALPPATIAPGPGEDTPLLAAAEPLVAQMPIGDSGLRLDVTYIPESERMLVAAIGLSADGVHDHELWLVPPGGGAPQSLGVVAPGEVRSTILPAEITRNLENGAAVVLTREPIGGKPADKSAGPVVAQGAFSQV